ncbi:MAG: hypothetical protein CSA34_08120 [Desulfobulbus propionicus]|nr:MAG: hypothetical protein CSA34_08120 [Desulfobulbus propionicus]
MKRPIVDSGTVLGEGTRIWHRVYICAGAVVGKGCSLGQNVFVGSKVIIGNNVKIQNNVSVSVYLLFRRAAHAGTNHSSALPVSLGRLCLPACR